jgi:uncharacterized protein (DUF1330 family)
MAAEHRYVMLIGLEVKDDALYRRYREEMTPILHRYGGGFGYDFVIAKTLKSEGDGPINRVFTIYFPDREVSARFFGDAAYQQIRGASFEPAVGAVTTLATFDEDRSA